MDLDISIPAAVPVMTLNEAVLFPNAIMPLFIFEPRYRQMLLDALAGDRIFAVVKLNAEKAATGDEFEPPCAVAGIGMVRACQKKYDGTSNLVLQGVCRAKVTGIVQEQPYRKIAIEPMLDDPTTIDRAELEEHRKVLAELITQKSTLSDDDYSEILAFLEKVNDPITYADLAAYTLCMDSLTKQAILETMDVAERYAILSRAFKTEVDELKLDKKLRGDLGDDVGLN